jgi:hypothetical protein
MFAGRFVHHRIQQSHEDISLEAAMAIAASDGQGQVNGWE